MTINDIKEALNARVLCGEHRLGETQEYVFASDLMSEILTLGDIAPMIITGLCTMQTIRTCEMGNLSVILFVRKKHPSQEMIELAEDNDMILLECDYSMFKTCGLLYEKGLKPVF